jgi:hypothetical protein
MLSSQNPLRQPYNNPSPHNMKMIIQVLKYQGFGWLIRFYFQPFIFNLIFFLFCIRDQKLKIKYKLLKKFNLKRVILTIVIMYVIHLLKQVQGSSMINVRTIKVFFFFLIKRTNMRDKLHIPILAKRDYSERADTMKTVSNSNLTRK